MNFVRGHLLLFAAALGPIGLAAYALYKNWSSVWSGIRAVISAAWSVISPIVDQIEGAVSRVASAVGSISSALSGASSIASTVGGALSHIPGFASGTDYAPGGLALVGESGPELVRLPRGSAVTPAAQTAQALGTDMTETNGLLAELLDVLKSQPREMQRLARTA